MASSLGSLCPLFHRRPDVAFRLNLTFAAVLTGAAAAAPDPANLAAPFAAAGLDPDDVAVDEALPFHFPGLLRVVARGNVGVECSDVTH